MNEELSYLKPYTDEELKHGSEQLENNISSISHDVEAGEKLKIDVVLDNLKNVSRDIANKTSRRHVVLGSMGMYARLNELQDGEPLMILEQRIAGGKNDYDFGASPENFEEIMTDFEWSSDNREKRRGFIGSQKQMVDLLPRVELPHFAWESIKLDGQAVNVQSAEEMIFEKMTILLADKEQGPKEIKWGVDIKLLKAYLAIKNGWTVQEVEDHLESRWNDYVEDVRYSGIGELVESVRAGNPVPDVLRKALVSRTGNDVTDLSRSLVEFFDEKNDIRVNALIASKTPEEFSGNLSLLAGKMQGPPALSYKVAADQANNEYSAILGQAAN